jgi:hypothetical protein
LTPPFADRPAGDFSITHARETPGNQGSVDAPAPSTNRERLRKFSLTLHPEKTRLIEFGRHVAVNRGIQYMPLRIPTKPAMNLPVRSSRKIAAVKPQSERIVIVTSTPLKTEAAHKAPAGYRIRCGHFQAHGVLQTQVHDFLRCWRVF